MQILYTQLRNTIILLFQTNEETLRTFEYTSIFLASLANSRSIDNREEFLNIINKEFVEQPFISLL